MIGVAVSDIGEAEIGRGLRSDRYFFECTAIYKH